MLKLCAYSYNSPVSAILVGSFKKKVLTIEKLIFPSPNTIANIIKELRNTHAPIHIALHEPLRLELGLRPENQHDLENEEVMRVAKDLYQVIRDEQRLVENVAVDVSKPFIWKSLCVLLNAGVKHLCVNSNSYFADSAANYDAPIREIHSGQPDGLHALEQHHSRYYYGD